jgi:hypothetical protein
MRQINLRVDEELLERLDAARGGVPRNVWVRRAVEAALGWVVDPADLAPSKPKPPSKPRAKVSEVERVRSEVARIGGAGGRGAHLQTCRCGLCLAGRREGS